MGKIKLVLVILIMFQYFNLAQEVRLYNETNSPLTPSKLSCLAVDSSNTIWIGSKNKQLIYFNNGWNEDTTIWAVTEKKEIDDIEVSPSGTVWIGVSFPVYSSLCYRTPGGWNSTNDNIGLYQIGNICIENDSTLFYSLINIWIQTIGWDAIAIYSNETSRILLQDYYWMSEVASIDTDSILFSCGFGIIKSNGVDVKVVNPTKWIPDHIIKTKNQIFVYGERLAKYELGLYFEYPQIDSLLLSDSSSITSIALEGEDIWIGTDKGKLIKYGENIKTYQVSSKWIRDLSIDKYLNKWFFNSNGCFVFNEDKIVNVGQYIDAQNSEIPAAYMLFQNYPNPFNPTTIIKYSVPLQSNVSIKIYDILGKEISTLVNEEKGIGNYSVEFNSVNLSSGIYFYQMRTDNYTLTRKMLLLR